MCALASSYRFCRGHSQTSVPVVILSPVGTSAAPPTTLTICIIIQTEYSTEIAPDQWFCKRSPFTFLLICLRQLILIGFNNLPLSNQVRFQNSSTMLSTVVTRCSCQLLRLFTSNIWYQLLLRLHRIQPILIQRYLLKLPPS
jgi:hypothetical protein